MRCCICARECSRDGLRVLELRLCSACVKRLAQIPASCREYDWYLRFPRSGVALPLLRMQTRRA